MSKKQKIYTAEFKTEAIKTIESNNINVSETARQLGISMQILSNWYNKAKAGTLAGKGYDAETIRIYIKNLDSKKAKNTTKV